MAEIYDASPAHEFIGRPAISDRDQDAALRLGRGFGGDADFGSERIKPGCRSEFIGIEFLPIRHEPAAMVFAVPRSHSVGGRLTALDSFRADETQRHK